MFVQVLRRIYRRVRAQFHNFRNYVHVILSARQEKVLRRLVSAIEQDQKVRRNYVVQSIPYPIERAPESRDAYIALVQGYTNPRSHMRDPIRIAQFHHLVGLANEAEPGDYLEIGTFQGDSARVIYKYMDQARSLFCIDTFEGFRQADLIAEQMVTPNHSWTVGNFEPTSAEAVKRKILQGADRDNVHVIKGWFPEAFSGLEQRRWRFIHLDMDLYEPTRKALEILWPKLLPGGVMLFHDYGNDCFPGIKVAVDAFFDHSGVTAIQLPDLWGTGVVVKPREPGQLKQKIEARLLDQEFGNGQGVGTTRLLRFDCPLAAGRYYWEVHSPNAGLFGPEIAATGSLGVIQVDHPLNAPIGTGKGWGWRFDGKALSDGGTTPSGIACHGADSVVMIAVDVDAGALWFGLNGTWFSGEPGRGGTPTFENVAGPVYPVLGSTHGENGTATLRSRMTAAGWRYPAPPTFVSPSTSMS